MAWLGFFLFDKLSPVNHTPMPAICQAIRLFFFKKLIIHALLWSLSIWSSFGFIHGYTLKYRTFNLPRGAFCRQISICCKHFTKFTKANIVLLRQICGKKNRFIAQTPHSGLYYIHFWLILLYSSQSRSWLLGLFPTHSQMLSAVPLDHVPVFTPLSVYKLIYYNG